MGHNLKSGTNLSVKGSFYLPLSINEPREARTTFLQVFATFFSISGVQMRAVTLLTGDQRSAPRPRDARPLQDARRATHPPTRSPERRCI